MNKNNFVHTRFNQPFIPQRADPYILHHKDGSYFFTASVPEYDRIVLRRASTLAGLRDAEEINRLEASFQWNHVCTHLGAGAALS